jgi:hypothetical protein
MNCNARLMLESLRDSSNLRTRANAEAILIGREIPLGEHYYTAEELATMGSLGGFLKAVMSGNLTMAWRLADEQNKEALATVVPVDQR